MGLEEVERHLIEIRVILKQLFRVITALFLFSGKVPLYAQYSGGNSAGVGHLTSYGWLLNGEDISTLYTGGHAKGDFGGALNSLSVSGINYQVIYGGDHGNGESVTDYYNIGVDGNIYFSLYRGQSGSGESASPLSLFSVSGESLNPVYEGDTGRGDTGAGLFHETFDGDMLGVSYKGDLGRGDHVDVANSEILHCTNYSVWTGTVSTAWENPANWQCGELPHRFSDVLIPTTVPNFPYITVSPVEIRNLTMDNSSMLHVIGVPLNILGGNQ